MSSYMAESSTHPHKRVRFSPSAISSSPEPALTSTSTTGASSSTNASDYTSNNDNDSDSELSSSSEEPSDDSSSEEEDQDGDTDMSEHVAKDGVVNLVANRGKKPVMKLGVDDEELGPDIRGFLKDFLPQLKASNDELERQKKAGTLQSIDAPEEEEGKPYIEMDLGLGVLEEKDPNKDSNEDGAGDTEDQGTEKDVLGRLMGREKKDPAGIEVVQNNTSS